MSKFWDERYDRNDYVYGTEANDFLKQTILQIGLRSKAKVLCLAEGEGRNAVFLAEKGAEVTAVDYSAVALQKAKRLSAQKNVHVETLKLDLIDEQLPDYGYDVIIMIFCHLPYLARRKIYNQVKERLKPGGYLILEGYTTDQLMRNTGGPKDSDLMFSSSELANAFDGFSIHLNHEIIRLILEGQFHTGDGAVCQFIAQKPEN